MKLYGKKCLLRPLRKEDANVLADIMGEPEVMENISAVFPVGESDLERWIEHLYRGYPPREVVFAIEVEGKVVGTVSLHDINWTSRHGTFSIVIWNTEYHGKGIGTEATSLMLRYAFEYLNLHRVKLEVYEYNEVGLHIYKKLGFVEEGRWRKQRYLKGKYYDVVLMGILREEWQERFKFEQK